MAESTTPTGLINHISHLLATPPDRLVIAKHKFESFKWIRLEEQGVSVTYIIIIYWSLQGN